MTSCIASALPLALIFASVLLVAVEAEVFEGYLDHKTINTTGKQIYESMNLAISFLFKPVVTESARCLLCGPLNNKRIIGDNVLYFASCVHQHIRWSNQRFRGRIRLQSRDGQ